MRFDFLKHIWHGHTYYCPICHNELRIVYIMDSVFCCLKCDIVWELRWIKTKQTIKQVKEDGWLKGVEGGKK